MDEDKVRATDGALVLTASRRKWTAVLAGCTVFAVAGLLMVRRGESVVLGWFSVVFFGAGLILSVLQLVAPSRLVVSHETIEGSHLGRRWTRDLARCGPFEVWRRPWTLHSMVVFDHPDDARHRLAGLSRAFCGHTSSLPDTFGRRPSELARILNEARANARARTRVGPDSRDPGAPARQHRQDGGVAWAAHPLSPSDPTLDRVAAALDPVLAPLGFAAGQAGGAGGRAQFIFCRGDRGSADGGCVDLVVELEASPEWHVVDVRYWGWESDRWHLAFDAGGDLDAQLSSLAGTLPGALTDRGDGRDDETFE